MDNPSCTIRRQKSLSVAVAVYNRDRPLPIFNWVQRSAQGRFDPLTPACLLVLTLIGICFIYSAQIYTGSRLDNLPDLLLHHSPSAWPRYFMQFAWLGVGMSAYLVVSQIDYKIYLKYAHWAWFGATLLLCTLVFIPGVGVERLGAKRWIDFGFVSLQPSEPGKLGVLIMCASILARSRVGSVRNSLWTLAKLALAAGVPMLLIMIQPDLGSALVVPPMVFSLLYVSNLSKRFFAIAILAFGVLVSVISWDIYRYNAFLEEHQVTAAQAARQELYASHSWLPYLHDYQRNRMLSFVAPYKVDRDISWNQRQSLITVGSGGLFGKGITQGTQARLGYLPRAVAHNDFIFSVLAEETGFLGSVIVLGLFGLVLANGVRIASLARDRFGTLLALGVTAMFAVHVFVNIGMTIGLVPITGLPLPFLSYGGTFLLSCFILQGLVQSVYRFRKDF